MSFRGAAAAVLALAVLVVASWLLLDQRLTGIAARLDRDGSGELERDEVGPVAGRAFAWIDRNDSGGVDGVEFRLWVLRQWWKGDTRPLSVPAPPETVHVDVLREWMHAPIAAGHLEGVGLLVLSEGEVVFRTTAGSLRPDMPVPLASGSKWPTAATFACLAERGDLDLESPVGRAMPSLPAAWHDVTMAQMLSHTSGAPGNQALAIEPRTANAHAGRMLADAWPPEEPGARFAYGGVSMQVAGTVAESVTGKSWRRLFVECLAWPLSLETAEWGHPLAAPGPIGYANLGGGLWMSLNDYGDFLSMLQQEGRFGGVQVLQPESVRNLFRDRVGAMPRETVPPAADPSWGYALGAWCEQRVAETPDCARLNSAGAYGAFPWLDRESGLAGVILVVDSLPRVIDWHLATRELVDRVFAASAPSSP